MPVYKYMPVYNYLRSYAIMLTMHTNVRQHYTVDTGFALIVDVQQRLMSHIHEAARLSRTLNRLVRGLQLLEVDTLLTEQYPKGLGPTVAAVADHVPSDARVEKMEFSCCRNADVCVRLPEADTGLMLYVAGIETPVCVQQTVVDAMRSGYAVTVLADAVSSRSRYDRDIALNHMQAEGARISTVEAVLFELCGVSGTPQFKQLSRILK